MKISSKRSSQISDDIDLAILKNREFKGKRERDIGWKQVSIKEYGLDDLKVSNYPQKNVDMVQNENFKHYLTQRK